MILFVNRATSDEWWRAITDSVAAGYTRFTGVKRISPQFYTHNYNPEAAEDSSHIGSTLIDERCAAKFFGRVFFTQLNKWQYMNNSSRALAINVAPALNYVDHISGHG